MSRPSFASHYWASLTGATSRSALAPGVNRDGHSFWRRYWASLIEADLPARSSGGGWRPVRASKERTDSHWAGVLSPVAAALAIAVLAVGLKLAAGDSGTNFTPVASVANDLAFSPDGEVVATGTSNGLVYLRAADDLQVTGTLSGASGVVTGVAFSPNGAILAAGDTTGDVSLWDLDSGQPVGGPLQAGGAISVVTFSPDGRTLAVGGASGVSLWNVATRQSLWSPSGTAVNSLAFSPDGRTLAAGGASGVVQLWDVNTRHVTESLNSGGVVSSMAFSPDSGELAVGDAARGVRLLDVADGRETGSSSLGDEAVSSVAFSPDGAMLAVGDAAGGVRLWNVITSQQVSSEKISHSRVNGLAFNPDGTSLAVSTTDGQATLLNVASEGATVKSQDVANLFSVYFAGINTRNYAEYSSALDQAMKVANPEKDFDSGYATTTDSNVNIERITSSGQSLTVVVLYTSRQNPADSVDNSTCNNWTLTLPLVKDGPGYLIATPPSGYATYADC